VAGLKKFFEEDIREV